MKLSAKRPDPRLLICAKNTTDHAVIKRGLDGSCFLSNLITATCFAEAEERAKDHLFDSMIIDSQLLVDDCDSAFEFIQEVCEQTAVIFIGDRDHEARLLQALENGAEDYLLKDELPAGCIEHAITAALSRRKGRRPQNALDSEIKDLENLLERIFRTHTDPMLILGKNHKIRFLNPSAVSLLEADEASVVGEVFPFAVKEGQVTELEIPTSGNIIHAVELTAFELIWKGEDSLLIILREMTTDREAQQNLLREQERLSVLLDLISDAVILTDHDGRIESVNRRANELLGSYQNSFGGLHFTDIIQPDPSGEKSPASAGSQKDYLPTSSAAPCRIQSTLQQADGNERPVSATLHGLFDEAGKRRSCVVVLQQTPDKDSGETMEPLDSEALDSVGLQVGGIAHDFNNMLTAILGNIALARLAAEDDGVVSQKLEAAESAALQAKSLSQQLLTFSRAGALTLTQTNLPDIIEECARFILRGSNVDFKLTTEEHLWPVEVDAGRISQVINNLLINADHAMPKGGCIEICLRNLNIRRSEVPELPLGDYVCIEVKDTGTGISPETLKQIFTPYFTTKQSGNGLGLASSYSIVRSHKGTITADSSLGYGSIFRIYLPKNLSNISEPEGFNQNKTMEDKKPMQRGHGRILLMDDMDAMLMVAGEILGMLGYEVECCADGKEAIDIYKKQKESGKPFDAVVFDLTVPGGMGGEEAANILKAYDPNLIAIASSGYSNSNVMSDHKNSAFKTVVPKPYRIDEMSDALHSVLNGK